MKHGERPPIDETSPEQETAGEISGDNLDTTRMEVWVDENLGSFGEHLQSLDLQMDEHNLKMLLRASAVSQARGEPVTEMLLTDVISMARDEIVEPDKVKLVHAFLLENTSLETSTEEHMGLPEDKVNELLAGTNPINADTGTFFDYRNQVVGVGMTALFIERGKFEKASGLADIITYDEYLMRKVAVTHEIWNACQEKDISPVHLINACLERAGPRAAEIDKRVMRLRELATDPEKINPEELTKLNEEIEHWLTSTEI
tara:strand:+ start:1431 stop:2207 length:777 start_codon:yes stop_codon:yes gene_type:complete